MAGRIGSTSPMPMNDTTQANATAKTAFGCRNGLATEPWVPLIGCSLSGTWWSAGCLPRPSWTLVNWLAWSGELSRAAVRASGGRLGVGERVHGRQRRAERGLLLRTEPGQDLRQPFGPYRAALGQHRPALVGEADLHGAPVSGVSGPVHQARFLQTPDQLRHGRLSHPL